MAQTKQDIVNSVAQKASLTKKQAGAAVEAVLGAIEGALAKGEKVSLIGFGSFEVRQRAAREGRNPQTGRKIRIRAKKVPAFKAGKQLRDAVD